MPGVCLHKFTKANGTRQVWVLAVEQMQMDITLDNEKQEKPMFLDKTS